MVEIMKICNKTKRKYQKLINDGFYLKPNIYKDGKCFEIVKDLHPVNCSGYRTLYGTVSHKTGLEISKFFNMKIKNSAKYFGFVPKIDYGLIQH